jgi:hypothetical protein
LQAQIPVVVDWPPNAPDLSPIENVWGLLKIRVAAREPKRVADLRPILLEEWDDLEQDAIDRLMDTMPERFTMCIEAEGKFITLPSPRTGMAQKVSRIGHISSLGVTPPRRYKSDIEQKKWTSRINLADQQDDRSECPSKSYTIRWDIVPNGTS